MVLSKGLMSIQKNKTKKEETRMANQLRAKMRTRMHPRSYPKLTKSWISVLLMMRNQLSSPKGAENIWRSRKKILKINLRRSRSAIAWHSTKIWERSKRRRRMPPRNGWTSGTESLASDMLIQMSRFNRFRATKRLKCENENEYVEMKKSKAFWRKILYAFKRKKYQG